jgi:glycogen debranching enzyme
MVNSPGSSLPPAPPLGPLHEVTCVRSESFVVSGPDGDLRPPGDHGFYVRDVRFLSQLVVTIDGAPPHPLEGGTIGPDRATFYSYVPADPNRTADAELIVERRRVVDGSLHEEILLDNRGREPIEVVLEVTAGTDLAYIFDVKHGRDLPRMVAQPLDRGVAFARDEGPERVAITATPAPEVEADTLRWNLRLDPRGRTRVCLDVSATDTYGTVTPRRRCGTFEVDGADPTTPRPSEALELSCSDRRFERLVRRGLDDLETLVLDDPLDPADRFAAAGSPWFLTLFGRDSIWAAFMALPHHLDLAGGTLRALARRQGTRHDQETEEAPGKILHEVRRGSLTHRGDLPPNYYGSVDATPLFVILLSEAWHCGLPDEEVAALLPNLEAALQWIEDTAQGEGFLRYSKPGERGLDNQGWKDSHDAIQFHDGRLAEPPIALAEVQGYAHDAALRGAELLDRFGRDGGDRWRTWGGDLATRFRERFWVHDDDGSFPALALDGSGEPVDAPASNMGHLPMSGILSDGEVTAVGRRLRDPTLDSGWGLRTISTTAAGYNPLSYHAGSVWPHDTAIAIWSLALRGQAGAAGALARSLLDAAPHFSYRLPEVMSGIAKRDGGFPVPFPRSCRPQAWAATSGLLMLRASLGLVPHLPDRRLLLRPLWPPLQQRLEVRGLHLGQGSIDVRIDASDGIDLETHDLDLEIDVEIGQPVAT